MRNKEVEHCERTGRIVGHCGCGDCYARRLAKLVQRGPGAARREPLAVGYPRYLVTNAL